MLPWVERYRPKSIDNCILPRNLAEFFGQVVQTGDVPNMILNGSAGCGKTTIARAMCEDLGLDYMFINGSEDSGIDVLRTKIRDFASTVSLSEDGHPKVVILDEADYLNPQSTQPALRGFIEEFAKTCRFILTSNNKSRIIQPLHSRCSVIDFNAPLDPEEKKSLLKAFIVRAKEILDKEQIEYDIKAVGQLVVKQFPDFRRTLNTLAKASKTGSIGSAVLGMDQDFNLEGLIAGMKAKNFDTIRKWVAENTDKDAPALYRALYDQLRTLLKSGSIPTMVLILADYQYKAAFVADQEINLAACCLMIASDCEFA